MRFISSVLAVPVGVGGLLLLQIILDFLRKQEGQGDAGAVFGTIVSLFGPILLILGAVELIHYAARGRGPLLF